MLGTWDQTAYNEEQFYPAHGQHGAVGVSSRVMNYLCHLNSKTFFRFMREDAELLNVPPPPSPCACRSSDAFELLPHLSSLYDCVITAAPSRLKLKPRDVVLSRPRSSWLGWQAYLAHAAANA